MGVATESHNRNHVESEPKADDLILQLLLFVLRAKHLDSLKVQATADLLLSFFSCTMTRVEYRASLLMIRVSWICGGGSGSAWVMVIGCVAPSPIGMVPTPEPNRPRFVGATTKAWVAIED